MPALSPVDVIDLAMQATTAYQRPDLGTRLARRREQLLSADVRVLVVGEFKQGKSQLINALITAPVCPVGDDIATSVPTLVRYSATPQAVLIHEPQAGSDGLETRTSIPMEAIADYVSELGNPGNQRRLNRAEIGIPRNILSGGLTLVDTPGVGGLGSLHSSVTMATLPSADAVLMVSDASAEYSETEVNFLRQACEICPNVLGVLTKIDLYQEWQRIKELDEYRLREAGLQVAIIPISSTLRLHAVNSEDQELNAESGFPVLIDQVVKETVAQATQLTRQSVAREILMVTDQLASTLRAELAAQQDRVAGKDLVAKLEDASQRAERLRQQASRWQQTLNDGVSDLTSDIEHDLRERLRDVTRQAEDELDTIDPNRIGDQFTTWLERQIAAATSANFVWASQRSRWLAERVALHFAEEGAQVLPDLPIGNSEIESESIRAFALPKAEKFGAGQKLLAGMRGGYGGTLMFGMLGTLAGLAMFNPISVTAGFLLGGKTVRDERQRLLQRRQMEAKNAVRRHVDEVIFQVSKETRDMLRTVQRALRDHFSSYAEELHRSAAEALINAKNALNSDASHRKQRSADLEAELARVANLADLARQLHDTMDEVAA